MFVYIEANYNKQDAKRKRTCRRETRKDKRTVPCSGILGCLDETYRSE